MKSQTQFDLTIATRKVVMLGGEEYPSVKDAQIKALNDLLLVEFSPTRLAPVILENAEEVIAILSYKPNGETTKPKRPVQTYSDEDFEAARAECGYPVKILRQRVGLGWTLNEAKTRPYTRRARNATLPATLGLLEEKP